MASKIILLLLLGFSLTRGDASTSGAVNSKFNARIYGTQDTLVKECSTVENHLNPNSVIRAIINGDWERIPLVLQMANESCTLERQAIYKALWHEWQQDKQIYDHLKILALFEQLDNYWNVPRALHQNIYQAFVSRSAQLLSAPFHTDIRSIEFPVINSIMSHLSHRPEYYLEDILETLFDMVLSVESTLTVAQRLGNLNGSPTQLTMANLQLLNRPEVQLNSSAHAALLENLRQLVSKPMFKWQVESSLQYKLWKYLPSNIMLLATAKSVCFRKANNDNEYLKECSEYKMCTGEEDDEKMAFDVRRRFNQSENRTQFLFSGAHWDNNRRLATDSSVTVGAGVTNNLCIQNEEYWWHVEYMENGVAIYDAATFGSVICGGDPAHWEDSEHYAYTRRAEDFDAHREDCTWIIENCKDD